MREVLGEHGLLAARSPSAASAEKPTEVGDGARRQNSDKALRAKDDFKSEPLPMWGRVWGYPRRPDFLQRRFELCPIDTASLIFEKFRAGARLRLSGRN